MLEKITTRHLLGIGAACLILVLMMLPGEIWRHPSADARYSPFDQTLLTHVSNSESSTNLLTTPLRRFEASLDIKIDETSSPVRLDVWSPWVGAGALLSFATIPTRNLVLTLVSDGVAGPTLSGGRVLQRRSLGGYLSGRSYHVSVLFNRDSKEVVFRIAQGDSTVVATVTGQELPDLFKTLRVSMTSSIVGPSGSLQLTNYSVRLPHQRFWAVRADDMKLTLLVLLAVLLGLAVLLWGVANRHRPPGKWSVEVWRGNRRALWNHRWIAGAMVLLVAGYLTICALSFGLGAQPFDIANEKVYSYVAHQYGPAQLYYLPSLISPAWVWSGTPYNEASFPYEPTFAYLFTGIGWIHGVLWNVWGQAGMDAAQLEYTIKTVNVLFALADAMAIYLILRELGTKRPWRLIAAAAFLINPAVWFSTSLWGQTHVISLFFLLIAIWLLERRLQFGAWLALAAAALTRPQMLVLCLLLTIVLLRRFPWRDTLVAISQTVIAVFIMLLPLTLAIGPSLPVDIMLNNLRIQEGGGNEPGLTTVSQDAYSLWPLVTEVTAGARGLERMFTPSAAPLAGTISYQQTSQSLTLAAVFLVGFLLWIRAPSLEPGGYLPYLALGITGFLLLQTGLVATHFVLALPFLLLIKRQLGTVGFFSIAILWSATTFISMYGDMGNVIQLLGFQNMPIHPSVNPFTRFVVELYSADRVITTAVVTNICVFIWLAVVTIRNTPRFPIGSPQLVT